MPSFLPRSRPPYWFRAKRYGWGWGLPTCWQGWVVLLTHLGAIILIGELGPERLDRSDYLLALGAVTASLILFCWIKGEPPRWRWGKD